MTAPREPGPPLRHRFAHVLLLVLAHWASRLFPLAESGPAAPSGALKVRRDRSAGSLHSPASRQTTDEPPSGPATMPTRLSSLFRNLLLAALTLPGLSLAAGNETAYILQDAQRCLLLFAATGDEHFLRSLPSLAERYEKQLADQPGATAMSLWNVWLLHQKSVADARAHYAPGSPQLLDAVRQAGKAVDLLPRFLPVVQDETPPTLTENLRQLALLEAQGANQKLLGGDEQARREAIAGLQGRIEEQLTALPASPENEALRSHWRYLRLSEHESATLLYPFNAQLEYLLARLND